MAIEAKQLRKEVEALRPRIKIHHSPYYWVGKLGGSLRTENQVPHGESESDW